MNVSEINSAAMKLMRNLMSMSDMRMRMSHAELPDTNLLEW